MIGRPNYLKPKPKFPGSNCCPEEDESCFEMWPMKFLKKTIWSNFEGGIAKSLRKPKTTPLLMNRSRFWKSQPKIKPENVIDIMFTLTRNILTMLWIMTIQKPIHPLITSHDYSKIYIRTLGSTMAAIVTSKKGLLPRGPSHCDFIKEVGIYRYLR